jgi:hypothetical protein
VGRPRKEPESEALKDARQRYREVENITHKIVRSEKLDLFAFATAIAALGSIAGEIERLKEPRT